MRIGLAAIGIGAGADPEVLLAIAQSAERRGFARLWCGEHVVRADDTESHYPYAEDGRLAVPPDVDWLDPLVGLCFAAAVTSTIELATGVLLLPEHNPLLVAKQAATLDHLSGGRMSLGVGIGWSKEEFAALGVPFERRSARTEEYIRVLRRLWEDEAASFEGEFVRFQSVHSYPKPLRRRRIPILLGGNTDTALARAAAYGDGWYGFNLEMNEVQDRVGTLRELCRRRSKDATQMEVVVAPFTKPMTRDQLPELEEQGVTEVVVVGEPPSDALEATSWVAGLADDWIGAPASPFET